MIPLDSAHHKSIQLTPAVHKRLWVVVLSLIQASDRSDPSVVSWATLRELFNSTWNLSGVSGQNLQVLVGDSGLVLMAEGLV